MSLTSRTQPLTAAVSNLVAHFFMNRIGAVGIAWPATPKAAVGLLVALTLTGCGASGEASSAPAGPVTLRLGYFANITHAAALVGVERGIFASALGANVTIKTAIFNAGGDAATALLSNSIDAAFVGPNPAITTFTRSHGSAIRIVSGGASGGASLVVSPSITQVSDLHGATIATPQLGNTQDVALRYWLRSHQLTANQDGSGDVHVHPQDNAQTLQAFQTGQISGAWVPEPWASRLVLQGGGHVLVDERTLWPNRRFPTTLLVARTDFITAHPDVVSHLLLGVVRAVQYLDQNGAEAQATANQAIARITGKALSAAVIARAWNQLAFTYDPLAGALKVEAAHAHTVGLLGSTDLGGIFDLTLLNGQLTRLGLATVNGG